MALDEAPGGIGLGGVLKAHKRWASKD